MKDEIRCLLIDDDLDDRDFFKRTIGNMEANIILDYAPTGDEALKKLKSGNLQPKYIFLDLNMSPMDGLECLKKIKKIQSCTDVPVVIYSTTINEDTKYQTLSLGAFDHFEKPTDQASLEDYLVRLMQL